MVEIAPHDYPQASTGLCVILAGGVFQWGTSGSGTLWEIWGGSFCSLFC